jgi:hypothetical protein
MAIIPYVRTITDRAGARWVVLCAGPLRLEPSPAIRRSLVFQTEGRQHVLWYDWLVDPPTPAGLLTLLKQACSEEQA